MNERKRERTKVKFFFSQAVAIRFNINDNKRKSFHPEADENRNEVIRESHYNHQRTQSNRSLTIHCVGSTDKIVRDIKKEHLNKQTFKRVKPQK